MELYVIDWFSLDTNQEKDTSDNSSESTCEGEDEGRKKDFFCENTFVVRAFCMDQQGYSSVLDIHNFKPYFYVKVPNNWTMIHARVFVSNIVNKVKKWYSKTLIDYKLINAKPFYGFTADDKFRYLKLVFSCNSAFNNFKYLFNDKILIYGLNNNQPYYYEPYETNLKPLLRFIHCRNIKAVGWITAKYIQVAENNETTCDYHYTCNYDQVFPLDKDEMPKITYVGFDIECDSSHGDFPIANKDCLKLARDIIMEYINVRDLKIYHDLRPVIASFLYYAFHPNYTNFNLKSVKIADPEIIYYPDVKEIIYGEWRHTKLQEMIDYWAPIIYQKIIDFQTDTEQLVEYIFNILENYFPAVDTSESDYYNAAEQIVTEYKRQISNNGREIQKDPAGVVKLMLEIIFDPYYINLNINKLYTHRNILPKRDILYNLTYLINDICEHAYVVLLKERKYIRYRKRKIKQEKIKDKADDYVDKLNDQLNRYLPKPEDDPVVQIGSTFKKYGETDCYLKYIVCLKGCEPINNKSLIDFEFSGIRLPNSDIKKYIQKREKSNGIKIFPLDQDGDVDMEKLSDEFWNEWNQIILDERRAEQYITDKSQVIVESCETEADLLMKWHDRIMDENPDIMAGYNTFGFDYKFLYDRAQQLGIISEFCKLGKIRSTEGKLIKQELTSAGMGDNLLYYIEMQGRVSIDLYKVMQLMHNMDSYKLDSVCRQFLYKSKVDISPQEIFIKQRGTNSERREIAEYCLIDCILCNRLIDRFELLLNNIGMAQVCSVPLSYLFLRGQGIKLFSYVAKRCRERGYLIPVMQNTESEGKYEGAIVLEPDRGIHYDQPVVVADFNSLYPSCMISENLSHDSFIGSIIIKIGESSDRRGVCITDSKYEKALLEGKYPGWDYVDIIYDVYSDVPVAPGRKKTKKIVIGHKICRFAQPPDEKKSIIPSIEQELIDARKLSKNKRDEFASGTFKYKLYEGLQLAYKTTGNSLYGILGADSSQITLKEIAACTTATGRKLINFSSKFVVDNYQGSGITYGDSVASYTPVLIKKDNVIKISKIEDLADVWYPCTDSDKEYADIEGVMSWTESGWTKIHRVIRHKLASTKKMFRVLTHTGLVDVTSDHSLLRPDGTEVSPTSLKVGDELLQHTYRQMQYINVTYTEDEARIRGFFMGDGSCGIYSCASGVKSSWALNGADLNLIEFYRDLCDKIYPQFEWIILPTLKSSGVYKLVPRNSKGSGESLVIFIRNYREIMYDSNKEKKIPDAILNSSYAIRKSFWDGFYDADGDKDKHGYIRADQKNQVTCAQLALLGVSLGYNVSLNTRLDKPKICRITLTKSKQRRKPNVIKKLHEIDYDGGYVYDLTTDNHHFQAGVGSIIVHNTDSIFCKFNCVDRKGKKLVGLDAINKSILLCTEAAYLISKQLKKPHNLEFEKAIYPFILLSKKRYHGHYFTEYGSPDYYAKSMGIVLKRRDNAPIVKHVFGGMVDIIMNDHSIDKAITFVRNECDSVLKGKFPMEMFIISKTLKSYYKMPESVAHNVLAQRIGKRDPGNKPAGNDRVAYAFIINKDADKQGDRIETPEYIINNKLKLDYGYYITNQIAKPVIQIFKLGGKGFNVFDDILENYYLDRDGYARLDLTSSLFTIIHRKNKCSIDDSYIDEIFDGPDEDEDEDF